MALALVQKACAEGIARIEKGIRLEVGVNSTAQRTRHIPFFGSRQIHTVLLTAGPHPHSHLSGVPSSDSEQHEMWRSLDAACRPARFQWLLAKLAGRLGLDHTAANRPRTYLPLLRISLPSMACTTRDMQQALEKAGVLPLFQSVSMDRGLAVLDGALTTALIRCNTTAALLNSALQGPYTSTVLWDLAVQVSSSEELAALLEAVTPRTLPALRSLALVAEPGDDLAAIRADFATLEHPGITQLTLNSIELAGGFSTLAHLSGLQILAAWYEEDQGPPLNLGGDLTALSALRQLSSLAVHNLASSEGLTLLSHLTSLSITPQPGSRLTLGGLPALRQLSADLSSSGSSGRELLRRGSVAYVPPANGLGSLSQLELRCFVWGQAPAAAVAAPPAEPAGPPEPEAAEVDEAEAGGVGEGSDSEDEEPGEDDASVASEADVDAFWQDDAASDGGSEAGAEGEDDVLEAMQGDADAGAASEEDGDEEEEVAAEEGEVGGARGGCERDSLARLERCYLSRLLERLPTLTSILLLDYLGPVATLSSKGAGQGGGARAGAGAGSGGGSVWQNTVTRTIGGAVWQRSISEVPAATPGTAGQCDIQYTWQQTDVQ